LLNQPTRVIYTSEADGIVRAVASQSAEPMKFAFIVNLKAAKQIGLTVPPNVLVRADWVIR
jgi:hypothetical protein